MGELSIYANQERLESLSLSLVCYLAQPVLKCSFCDTKKGTVVVGGCDKCTQIELVGEPSRGLRVLLFSRLYIVRMYK